MMTLRERITLIKAEFCVNSYLRSFRRRLKKGLVGEDEMVTGLKLITARLEYDRKKREIREIRKERRRTRRRAFLLTRAFGFVITDGEPLFRGRMLRAVWIAVLVRLMGCRDVRLLTWNRMTEEERAMFTGESDDS